MARTGESGAGPVTLDVPHDFGPFARQIEYRLQQAPPWLAWSWRGSARGLPPAGRMPIAQRKTTTGWGHQGDAGLVRGKIDLHAISLFNLIHDMFYFSLIG